MRSSRLNSTSGDASDANYRRGPDIYYPVVQFRFLREIGCEFGQGYLFSAAVPADEMESLLADAQPTGGVAVAGL